MGRSRPSRFRRSAGQRCCQRGMSDALRVPRITRATSEIEEGPAGYSRGGPPDSVRTPTTDRDPHDRNIPACDVRQWGLDNVATAAASSAASSLSAARVARSSPSCAELKENLALGCGEHRPTRCIPGGDERCDRGRLLLCPAAGGARCMRPERLALGISGLVGCARDTQPCRCRSLRSRVAAERMPQPYVRARQVFEHGVLGFPESCRNLGARHASQV